MDNETFEEAQRILAKNFRRNKKNRSHRYPYLLSGLVSCGVCGDRMTGKSAHGNGGKIPYYEHSWQIRKQSLIAKKSYACTMYKRVLAKSLEAAAWKEIKILLTNPFTAKSLIEEARKEYERDNRSAEQETLKSKISEVEARLSALAEHLSQIPKGVSPAPIFVQMKRLEEMKTGCVNDLVELERSSAKAPPVTFERYQEYLTTAKAALDRLGEGFKADIVQRLVRSIEVLPATFVLHFNVGEFEKNLDFGSNTVDDE